jgi:hypothetical protein
MAGASRLKNAANNEMIDTGKDFMRIGFPQKLALTSNTCKGNRDDLCRHRRSGKKLTSKLNRAAPDLADCNNQDLLCPQLPAQLPKLAQELNIEKGGLQGSPPFNASTASRPPIALDHSYCTVSAIVVLFASGENVPVIVKV